MAVTARGQVAQVTELIEKVTQKVPHRFSPFNGSDAIIIVNERGLQAVNQYCVPVFRPAFRTRFERRQRRFSGCGTVPLPRPARQGHIS